MPQTDKTKDYLREVCTHIRWKRAHETVRKELEAHIEYQRGAFIAAGMDESTADGKAVEEMGDAATVGSLLDRSYRPKPAWGIIVITAILMLVGYLSRLYIINQYSSNYSPYAESPVQVFLWLIAAIVALIVGYFLDFTFLMKYTRVLRVIYYAVLAILVFIAFSRGYVYILTVCTHCLLMIFPAVYAGILCSVTNKKYKGFMGCCVYLAVAVFSGFVVPSFVPAMLCWFIGLFLLTFDLVKGFFKINKLIGLLIIYLPPLSLFTWVWMKTHYPQRLLAVLHPEVNAEGIGDFNSRVRDLLYNARILGTGSYTYEDFFLPSPDSDYVLTYLTHKLGWVSFIAITALFALLFIILSVLIFKQKNQLGQMVSITVFLTLFAEFAIYIMNNLGYCLVNSISLPLISYGNSELITNAFLIGLMLSVFRTGDLDCDKKTDGAADKANNDTGKLRFKIVFYRTAEK